MYHYMHEYVPRKVERKRLEFIAQVPLWAVSLTLQNLDEPMDRIVLYGECTEETRLVSIYLKE